MFRFCCILVPVLLLLAPACTKKTAASSDSQLYGIWVNENGPGDTLRFMQVGSKNVLRMNASFNTPVPTYTDYEYSFTNGQLSLATAAPSGPWRLISSFTWLQQGKEFDVLAFQLYLFLSSSVTHGRYRRI